MIQEIKNILENAENFKKSDYIEDIKQLIDVLIEYSNEPGTSIHDLREQLYLIKFEIE